MGIEDLPIIKTFDAYVESLPAESRAEAYSFARSFLAVGASNGIRINIGLDSDQGEMLKYIGLKEDEYKS